MRKKLLIYSNLFPSKAFPTRAMFNKQQFDRLADVFDVRIIVPVGWLEWIKHGYSSQQTMGNLKAYYFPYFYTPGFARGAYGVLMWLSLLIFRRALFSSNPDVVMASWAYPDAVAMARLLKRSEVPFFMKVHGSDINMHCRFANRRKQIVAAMHRASAVVSVSRDLKEKLVGYGVSRDKVRVIYNGVDAGKFFPARQDDARRRCDIAPEARVFLFIGNLLSGKGALDLLAAFGSLAANTVSKELALVYVGDGADRHLLETGVKNLKKKLAALDVRIVGSKPHGELQDWINAADVVCLPSHSEGVPNVLLEAMSCGKPVVATRVGGIPEVVSAETGILVEPKDIPGLTAAMTAALEVNWDTEHIAAHGQQFNWDKNVMEIVGVVNDTCSAVCHEESCKLT